MKSSIVIALVAMLVVTMFSGLAMGSLQEGPAPSSGDGASEGSGMEPSPNGDTNADSPGPAPNSGDGISDGSGFP
jgi:hypothetical protein